MKERTVTDIDYDRDDDAASSGGLTSRPAFAALVALWFAALFGAGCLFLPQVLFDAIFGGNLPFGPQTRIVFAIGAAGIGLVMGLFIASRVRDDDASTAAPAKPKPGRRGTRAPLDVRAALGLTDDDDDDDDDDFADDDGFENDDADLSDIPDHDAFDLTDEVSPPIDDPYFASAWSDSDAYAPVAPGADQDRAPAFPHAPAEQHEADRETDFAAQGAEPSRYNPFAEFIGSDDEAEPQEPVDFAPPRPSWESALSADIDRPRTSPAAPPPPPAWPQPRAEEPELTELGVAELVERLARALQGERDTARPEPRNVAPPRTGTHRHESALAPQARPAPDLDRDLRSALDRLSRLDDVA